MQDKQAVSLPSLYSAQLLVLRWRSTSRSPRPSLWIYNLEHRKWFPALFHQDVRRVGVISFQGQRLCLFTEKQSWVITALFMTRIYFVVSELIFWNKQYTLTGGMLSFSGGICSDIIIPPSDWWWFPLSSSEDVTYGAYWFLEMPPGLWGNINIIIFPPCGKFGQERKLLHKQNQSLRRPRARCVYSGHAGPLWNWWITVHPFSQSRAELQMHWNHVHFLFLIILFFIRRQEKSWFMLCFHFGSVFVDWCALRSVQMRRRSVLWLWGCWQFGMLLHSLTPLISRTFPFTSCDGFHHPQSIGAQGDGWRC